MLSADDQITETMSSAARSTYLLTIEMHRVLQTQNILQRELFRHLSLSLLGQMLQS